MKRSLKYQCIYIGQQMGIAGLIFLAFIPYAWLIAGSASPLTMFNLMNWMLYLLFMLLYPQSLNSTQSQMAISFGATRKSWLLAYIPVRMLSVLASTLAITFVIDPLAHFAFSEPFAFALGMIPLRLAAGMLASSLGALTGYLMSRINAKTAVLVLISLVLSVLGAGFGIMIGFGALPLFAFLQSVWFPLLLAALCVPLEFAGWLLVRNMAIKV